MPYNGSEDSKLPSYVKKLSKAVRSRWVNIFNKVYAADGEALAFRVANKWLKDHSSGRKDMTAKTVGETQEYFTLSFSFPETELVFKTEGDEEYIEAVLTDTDYDREGVKNNEKLLEEIAEQINTRGIVGDFDHEQFEALKQKYFHTPEKVVAEMKGKRGIAKAIKAIVSNGKLWIRAIIDKRYKKRILASKGLSLEGFFKRSGDTYTGGTILGFTFGEKQTPANPRAVISND